MFHLLQLEWLKQKNYILFKVLVIAYVALLPAMLMIGKKVDFGENAPFDPQIMFFHFPSVWEWLAYTGNWLTFFILGFLAVLMITNEQSYRTLRQNIITGMQRKNWFWSKVLFALVICLAATLYYAFCSVAIGLAHVDDTLYLSTVLKNSTYSLRYFLMCLGYMSFGLLVGFLVKRTGIALFVFLGYSLFLEPVIRWVIHRGLLDIKNVSMHLYPINSFEELCPVPFYDEAGKFMNESGFSFFLSAEQAVLAAVIWISLFGYLSYRRLATADL